MREPCSWKNTVPMNVTVIGAPVHGFTSGNTSKIGSSVGRSAAAGAANARATMLSRATTSLISGLPLPLWKTRWCQIVSAVTRRPQAATDRPLRGHAANQMLAPLGRSRLRTDSGPSGCFRRRNPCKRRAMRMRGLEPPRGLPHTDLNRARLPIPPHPRGRPNSSRAAAAQLTRIRQAPLTRTSLGGGSHAATALTFCPHCAGKIVFPL
jgi:hypothetical protein